MRLTIIIPVHNEAGIVEQTVARIASFAALASFESVNLVLVENGSSDDSKLVVKNLESSRVWPPSLGWICGTSSTSAGLGHAYGVGTKEALRRGGQSSNDWILWSACDTPFGCSDIEAFLRLLSSGDIPPIVIGSKGHPLSKVQRDAQRTIMSLAFRFLRRVLIGVSARDTQGTFFVRGDVVSEILERPRARDFFYTTEFCFHALQEKLTVVEVPVELSPELRPSTVRPFRDGWKMLQGLMRLRRADHPQPQSSLHRDDSIPSPLQTAAVILGALAFLYLRWGYNFGILDQWVHSIAGLKAAHPSLFARDFFATVITPHWLFALITQASEHFGILSQVYLSYWVFSGSMVAIGVVLSCRWLGLNVISTALAATMIMVMGPLIVLGSTGPLIGYALPHGAGAGVAILGISLILRGNTSLAASLIIVTVCLHLQHGANLALIALTAALADKRLRIGQRFTLIVGSFIGGILTYAIASSRGLATTGDDFVRLCTTYISFHCYAPRWPPEVFYSAPFLIFSSGYLLVRSREQRSALIATVLLPISVLIIGIIADRLSIPYVDWMARRFNVYRWVTLVIPFACIGFISFVQSARFFTALLVGSPLLALWLLADTAIFYNSPISSFVAAGALTILLAVSNAKSDNVNPLLISFSRFAVLISGLAMLVWDTTRTTLTSNFNLERSSGADVAALVPIDGLIVAPPHLHALRFTSRRSLVVDSKAIPHGGEDFREWERRIKEFGGYDSTGDSFRSLPFEALSNVVTNYKPTHILLDTSDSKFEVASQRWKLLRTFDFPSGTYALFIVVDP